MRVALYARFSSDLQKQSSIADQLRAARARADAEGWQVVIERSDEGVSGATPFALRAGGKALLADALAGRFDVLIVEGLDRTFRDVGEQEMVVKRLEHRGLRIIGTSDGYDSQAKGRKVMRIARGLVNELYLDDLREKTHRGLAGQFDRGMSAGGRSYGYRTEESPTGRRMVIDPTEAAVVLRIFEEYADGHSTRSIVHRLNADGIPSARGSSWAVSALVGTSKLGLGLLRNELYIGRVWWNRRQWLKDPETGKRRYVERPREEWQFRDEPALRIVPEDLWRQAHQKRSNGAERGTRIGKGAIPKALFSAALRCPACGGAMIAIDKRRYGCGVRKDRGEAACSNPAGFPRGRVDRTLLGLLREELLSQQALQDLQEAAREILAGYARDSRDATKELRQRLADLEVELINLADAIAVMGLNDTLRRRLVAAEQERAAAQRQLSTIGVVVGDLSVSAVVNEYRRRMEQLQQALEDVGDRDRARALIADVLGPVQLVREEGGAMVALLEEPAERLLIAGVGVPLGVVARAGVCFQRRVPVLE